MSVTDVALNAAVGAGLVFGLGGVAAWLRRRFVVAVTEAPTEMLMRAPQRRCPFCGVANWVNRDGVSVPMVQRRTCTRCPAQRAFPHVHASCGGPQFYGCGAEWIETTSEESDG